MSSWLCSVIPGVWTLPPSPPHKYPATFRLCVERCFEVFRNSHINRTAEIFIMSTFSLYRGDCNYQRMAPPSTIYEANQWEWSNSGNRHLLSCFDVSSVANVLGFPLFLAARTLWSYNNSYIFIHTLFCGVMFFMFLISLHFYSEYSFLLTLYTAGLHMRFGQTDLLNVFQVSVRTSLALKKFLRCVKLLLFPNNSFDTVI